MVKYFVGGVVCGATVVILSILGLYVMDKDLIMVEDTIGEDE